jgi:hypothetical protein
VSLPTPPLPPPPAPVGPSARVPSKVVLAIVIVLVVALTGSAIATLVPRAGPSHGPHAFLQQLPDGTPYRWDPCRPIHYAVNPDDEPSGAGAVVREAIGRISDATGIRFVDDGTTTETVDQQIGSAFQSNLPDRSRYLPVLIAFVPGEHFDFIADTTRALAFGEPYRGEGDLAHTYVSGVVAIDASQPLPAGFGSRWSLGPVLMHELGHVMGLAHVGAGDELMWSPQVRGHDRTPDLTQTDWGPGDLEGLRLVGRDAGCGPVP